MSFFEGYFCKKSIKKLISVATYLTTGRRKQIKESTFVSQEENEWESPPTFIRGKIRKTKRGLQILKRRIRELFTHGEGINTPCARHKGWQPLIECVQRDFRIIYFSLLYFFLFFWVDKSVALALIVEASFMMMIQV